MSKRYLAIALSGVLAAGCATTGERPSRTTTGAAIGAVTGAVIGNQVSTGRGAVVGGVIGGVAGGLLGRQMDEQERQLNEALAQERRANEIQVERVREDTLKLTLQNEVTFDVDKSNIRPDFMSSLDKLATVLTQHSSSVTIEGHTDSTGSDAHNQRLSEQRAQAVADYLAAKGVARSRLTTVGKGESQPRRDNSTEAGRQLNRRVEIYVQAEPAATTPAR